MRQEFVKYLIGDSGFPYTYENKIRIYEARIWKNI